jgi:hypothetical protein
VGWTRSRSLICLICLTFPPCSPSRYPSHSSDYRENTKLDRYDVDRGVDEEEVEAMDMTTRQLVEAKLRRRDRENARNAGLAGAFLDEGGCG